MDAKTKLSSTKIAGSEVKVHTSRPCPSAAFVAMHDSFAAQAAEHEMVVDEAVTPVASLKRGVRSVDVFSVLRTTSSSTTIWGRTSPCTTRSPTAQS